MGLTLMLGDCLKTAKSIETGSVDFGLHGPPYPNNLSTARRERQWIIPGYVDPPANHEHWTLAWMTEAVRVLKPNGSMMVFQGDKGTIDVQNAAHALGLIQVNHIIWKYSQSIPTTRKFSACKQHIFFFAKTNDYTFNTYCRYRDASDLCRDLQDVMEVPYEPIRNEWHNLTHEPKALIRKLLSYCTNHDDLVADFFCGNFTTAYCCLEMNRNFVGCEINHEAYHYHIPRLREIVLAM